MDNRAQAIGIARFFLGLMVGAIVIFIVGEVTAPLFEHTGEQSQDQVATQGTAWLQQGIDYLPIFFLLISFFGLISYSVYSRRAVR